MASVFQAVGSKLASLVKRVRYYFELAKVHRAPPAELFRRRRYYRKWLRPQPVPVHPVSQLPDGFLVRRLANTGVSIIDNFCTAPEARALIDAYRDQLAPSAVSYGGGTKISAKRSSENAVVFCADRQNPLLLPLLYRGAMLVGVPYNHAEGVNVTRYKAGQKFDTHMDCYPSFRGDRLYTILIYLNDLAPDQGGETVFDQLNVAVHPKQGRAITWTNQNPDGSIHPETSHGAMPVGDDAQKWVVQLWFRRYKMFEPWNPVGDERLQGRTGQAISNSDSLPDGVSVRD